jgi:hypothetical protein
MAKPLQRIRWTIERAAPEFGLNPRTLSARLKQSNLDPSADGTWTTQQIVRAIYNDLESERIRETRSKADLNEQELRKRNGELVDIEDFCKKFEPIYVNCARIVKSSKLTIEEQDSMLNDLVKIHKAGLK